LQYHRQSGVSALPLVERVDGVVSFVPRVNDDEALVHALRRRDAGAPTALFDRYAPYLQRVLARIVGYAEPERADLLHDVFVRALERIGELKNPRALKSWLVGITVFTAQEWIRRRKRVGPPQLPEVAAEREGGATSPETIEAFRSVAAVMNRMDDDDRTMFVLRFLEGMNLDEIATATRLSISTARRRVIRAEDRFRELLSEFPALLERLEASKGP
jgi:RNA polymerase sigma-70 factor (ECF subfamily)